MPRKQSRRSKKKPEPNIDLSDLSRAGEHFITSAAEFVVGAGFCNKRPLKIFSIMKRGDSF